MEKLLELLNEYRTEQEEIELYEFEVSQTLDSLNYLRLFIKWLVDNDKIDLLKLTCMNPRYTEILDSDFSWEDIIIMILSIQDTPIDFLTKIIK